MSMRSVLLLACTLLWSSLAVAQQVLVLRVPTIVILVAPEADIEKHKDDEGFNEFTSDFAVYANRMAEALRVHPTIQVQWSSASVVAFPGTKSKPIRRRSVGDGWGYIFYRPGRQPILIEGVAFDDHLVCTASTLYEVQVDGYVCGK